MPTWPAKFFNGVSDNPNFVIPESAGVPFFWVLFKG